MGAHFLIRAPEMREVRNFKDSGAVGTWFSLIQVAWSSALFLTLSTDHSPRFLAWELEGVLRLAELVELLTFRSADRADAPSITFPTRVSRFPFLFYIHQLTATR